MTIAWEAGVRDPDRLAAVENSGLVGTGPDDGFDRFAELAAVLLHAPRACITLVDAERTTAMSVLGFPEGAPRFARIDQSFCRFVVGSGRPLIVDDARQDPRTRGDHAIELYDAAAWAGYPIEDADGVVLGTFCVMDSTPHEWTATDLHVLATLAKAASSEIALRRSQAETALARREADALRDAIERLRTGLIEHISERMALGDPPERFGPGVLEWLDTHRATADPPLPSTALNSRTGAA